MLNKIQLIGRVGQDPKKQEFSNGTCMTSFSLATSERGFTAKDGTQIPEKTDWHNIVCFGRTADVAATYLRKGSRVYVEGKVHYRTYEKEGEKRTVTEINTERLILLETKTESLAQQLAEEDKLNQPRPQSQPQPQTQTRTSINPFDTTEEELPF